MELNRILVLGAGKSASSLIRYLLTHAKLFQWHITIGDISLAAASAHIKGYDAQAIEFNFENKEAARKAISNADVVVSVLPAHLHILVARICLENKKHLLTASYVSAEMKALHEEAKAHNLLFLNECGLDPGIDHMSAMQLIDNIKSKGGELTSFESFAGGLIAPETDPENPWRYKFTWNSRNVVMAGQGTAKFLEGGQYKYIPYQQLFLRTTAVTVPGYGEYEGYANRDSLGYLEAYGLQGIRTMVRGTLRNKGYCSAWNVLVQLGCCEDTHQMDVAQMTHREFINSFLAFQPTKSVEEKLCEVFSLQYHDGEMTRLKWSGFFSEELIGLSSATPAQVVEHILNKKWKLMAGDKDFIVMWHRFQYKQAGAEKEIQAFLTATGEDEINTAMAKTVGLPLAISTKLLMQQKIKSRGVVIPIQKEIYDPVLKELQELGISLHEQMVK